MFIAYPTLIKRNVTHNITSYYYPDFDYEYPYQDNNNSLSDDIMLILAVHVDKLSKTKSIPFPRKLSYYESKIPIGQNDHWVQCNLEPKFIYGVEKLLPSIGVVSSIIAAITMAIINFYTTNESMSSEAGVWFGSIGATLSAIMAIMIFYFSDASGISKIIGRKIDDFIGQKSSNINVLSKNQGGYAQFILKAFVTLIPILTTIFSSYNHFNQVIAVISNNTDNSSHISINTFKALSIIMIVFSSYSKLIFQLSFMPMVYDRIDNCIQLKSSKNCYSRLFKNNNQVSLGDTALLALDSGDEDDEFIPLEGINLSKV